MLSSSTPTFLSPVQNWLQQSHVPKIPSYEGFNNTSPKPKLGWQGRHGGLAIPPIRSRALPLKYSHLGLGPKNRTVNLLMFGNFKNFFSPQSSVTFCICSSVRITPPNIPIRWEINYRPNAETGVWVQSRCLCGRPCRGSPGSGTLITALCTSQMYNEDDFCKTIKDDMTIIHLPDFLILS